MTDQEMSSSSDSHYRRRMVNDEQEGKPYSFKVCLSGVSGVGKTSIFNCLAGKPFSNSPKVGSDTLDFTTEAVKGEETVKVTLKVWDTAGQERNDSMTLGYYRQAHLIIAVFDVKERDTLFELEAMADKIINSDNCPDVKFCYVGNKTDLKDWNVTEEEVTAYICNNRVLAKRTEAIGFTSAKLGQGVKEIFETAASILIGSNIPPINPSKGTVDFNKRRNTHNLPCCHI